MRAGAQGVARAAARLGAARAGMGLPNVVRLRPRIIPALSELYLRDRDEHEANWRAADGGTSNRGPPFRRFARGAAERATLFAETKSQRQPTPGSQLTPHSANVYRCTHLANLSKNGGRMGSEHKRPASRCDRTGAALPESDGCVGECIPPGGTVPSRDGVSSKVGSAGVTAKRTFAPRRSRAASNSKVRPRARSRPRRFRVVVRR